MGKYDRREQKLEYLLDSYKESLMPLMVDKMLAKGALDGRNEIVSLTSLFELEGAIYNVYRNSALIFFENYFLFELAYLANLWWPFFLPFGMGGYNSEGMTLFGRNGTNMVEMTLLWKKRH